MIAVFGLSLIVNLGIIMAPMGRRCKLHIKKRYKLCKRYMSKKRNAVIVDQAIDDNLVKETFDSKVAGMIEKDRSTPETRLRQKINQMSNGKNILSEILEDQNEGNVISSYGAIVRKSNQRDQNENNDEEKNLQPFHEIDEESKSS